MILDYLWGIETPNYNSSGSNTEGTILDYLWGIETDDAAGNDVVAI